MAYTLKCHDTDKGRIVAAADQALVGETLENGDVTLEVRAGFYAEEDVDLDRIVAELEQCFTANLVGTTLIRALIDRGTVQEQEVVEIDGVLHAQLFRL